MSIINEESFCDFKKICKNRFNDSWLKYCGKEIIDSAYIIRLFLKEYGVKSAMNKRIFCQNSERMIQSMIIVMKQNLKFLTIYINFCLSEVL